jgi:hypothetical protein
MLVGIYAFGYYLLARDPERYCGLIWIALAGKMLGPAGFLNREEPSSMNGPILTSCSRRTRAAGDLTRSRSALTTSRSTSGSSTTSCDMIYRFTYLADCFAGRVQKFEPLPGARQAKIAGQILRTWDTWKGK